MPLLEFDKPRDFQDEVTPLDIKSVPRLEVLGALILTRLITSVRRTLGTVLNLSEVYCWTDNTGVLYWINPI